MLRVRPERIARRSDDLHNRGVDTHLAQQTPSEPADKYQWLEDVSGERSMAWVKAENQRSAKVLESDPHYAALEATALKVLESPDRLPIPSINGDDVYNTWQDTDHVRGILRRTSLADYLSRQPHWQTLLDYDALGKRTTRNGSRRAAPASIRETKMCLVGLSAGGEDAVTMREFNLKTGKFVEGGFVLPRAKQDVTWVGQGHSAGGERLGGWNPDQSRLSVRGEALEARSAARPGQRGLPRRGD